MLRPFCGEEKWKDLPALSAFEWQGALRYAETVGYDLHAVCGLDLTGAVRNEGSFTLIGAYWGDEKSRILCIS